MNSLIKFILVISLVPASAQPGAKTPGVLTLEQYLEQVKTQSPEARALIQNVASAELRLREADVPLASEAYMTYMFLDDRREPTNPFGAARSRVDQYRMGVRDRTIFGLSTDVFVTSQYTDITLPGALPQNFRPLTDFAATQAGIQLTQSFWRNGFGEQTRAERELQLASSRLELLRRQFDLKNLLLRAKNTYWSLVSLNQIVSLQQENVDRAKRLSAWMGNRAGLRLVDDVDALQAKASLEQRALELQTSLDERASLLRQFNTLRGVHADDAGALSELPTAEFMLREAKNPAKRMSREDLRIAYEQAEINLSQARAANSRIQPQFDVMASVASNGLTNGANQSAAQSYEEIERLRNPTWQVGVTFSVPLDFGLIGQLRSSFRAQKQASEAQREAARFNEERVWDDLVKQKQEAQTRFERALNLEKLQTELVRREQLRLRNGRTTTFQAISLEQNLASAQVQRVRSHLALLQIHNVIKSFEEQP